MLYCLQNSTLGRSLTAISNSNGLRYKWKTTTSSDNSRGVDSVDYKRGDESDVEEDKKDELYFDQANETEPPEERKIDLVVGWAQGDPDDPQNWPRARKVWVSFVISILTFSVYIGSSIYTPDTLTIQKKYNVSSTKANLGLSLYVLAYGWGPMIFSPLSEIPAIGRTKVYIVTAFLYSVLQIPAMFAGNYSTMMAMRFLAGLFGSPALATGAASLGDIFSPLTLPYAVVMYCAAATAGPCFAPLIAGFAVQESSWRWPFYLLLILGGVSTLLMVIGLPETYSPTVLRQKAHDLRRLTRNKAIRAPSECTKEKIGAVLAESLLWPFRLGLEPIVIFANVYLGLVYGIFYLWFEAFPLVFGKMYNFSLGQQGLPFLAVAISVYITSPLYILYQKKVMIPKIVRLGKFIPEDVLAVSLFASVFIPVSLFWFGWASRPSVHWIVPIIGSGVYMPGIFLLFQSILLYLPLSFSKHAASVLAVNTMVRSTFAAAFPLFGTPLYTSLGIGPACSLLAGISLLMIPFLFVLYKHGERIRKYSRYAS